MRFEVDIPVDRKQLTNILIGLLFIVIAFGIANTYWFWEFFVFANLLAGLASIIIVLILLDDMGILNLRRTVESLNKCAICGAVHKNKSMEVISEKVTKEKIPKHGTTEKIQQSKRMQDEEQLDGIVVHDKLICINCANRVKKLVV